MPTIDDYNEWEARNKGEAVGAANVSIAAADRKPDEVAGDVALATDFAKATGNPQPPTSMVAENRPIFQQKVNEQRNRKILTASPRLTEWLRTPENAAVSHDDLSNLSTWEQVGMNIKEFGKAVPGGAVSSAGTALEGLGQVMTPVDPAVRKPLIDLISRAGSMTPEQVSALRKDIFKQHAIDPIFAQGVLSDVMDGSMKPADAFAALEPSFVPALKIISDGLQAGGEATQEFGAALLPAAPGMENSLGRELGSGLGSMLTILAVGATTGVVGAGVVAGSMGAGEAAANARNAGQDEDTQTIAAFYGILPGLTDIIPIERLLNNPVTKAGIGHFMRTLATQAALEGGQEGSQQFLQNIISQNLYAPDKGMFDEVAHNAEIGGLLGAMVEAGKIGLHAMIPGRFKKGHAAAVQAEDRKQLFQELSGNAQASEVRRRLPDKFREFVTKATEGGPVENVYVPAEQFNEYFQGIGIDPHELADTLEGVTREDLDAAIAAGGDLKIPTATYAEKIAGSEHDAFLMENMRFDPNDFTAKEAADFNAHAQDILDEAWAAAEDARQETEGLRSFEQEIRDTITSRLRAAGRSTDVANAEAALYPAFYENYGARNGMTPDEFMAKYVLPRIEGALPQGMQFRDVDELNRTLAAARSRKDVKDKRQTLLEFIDGHGGINDTGGELKSRDAETVKRGRGKKSLKLRRSSITEGMASMFGATGKKHGVDEVARAAIEAGFLHDDPAAHAYKAAMEAGTETPDVSPALWAAIDRELAGEAQYSANEQIDPAVEQQAALDGVEAYLDTLGVSLDDTDAAIRAAVEKDQAGKKYGQGGDPANMIVQHNLSSLNLIHADKMRGIAAPSVAITNVEYPLDGFGEITLLGSQDLIDPRKDSASKVFDADVYSPRYPSVRYKLAKKALDKSWKLLNDVSAELGHVLSSELDNSEIERSGLKAFEDSSAVQLKFLRDKGVAVKLPTKTARSNYLEMVPALRDVLANYHSFNPSIYDNAAAVAEMEKAIDIELAKIHDAAPDLSVKELRAGYYMRDGKISPDIFRNAIEEGKIERDPGVDRYAARSAVRDAVKPFADEFSMWIKNNFGNVIDRETIQAETKNGDWKYLPHTLDNVVKVLRRKLRDGEGFNYGIGSLRSNVANQFKSVTAIKAARGKLIPADAMKALKDEVSNEFVALASDFQGYTSYKAGFGFMDNFSEHLKEVSERGAKSLNQYYEYLPDNLVQDAVAFLDKLANMPTEYFEAKIQRAVDLSEFKAAVIPSDAPKGARDALKFARVPVLEYDPKVTGARAAMIKRAAGEGRLLFQRDIAADTAGLSTVEFGEFATGKPVTFDFLHNTDSATKHYGKPKKGDRHARDLEPSGRYMTKVDDITKAPTGGNLVSGSVTFQNPLVLNTANWKQELSAKYGSNGKRLSKALLADGYDGVVTVAIDARPGLSHASEILDLTTFDAGKALYQSAGPGPRGSIQIPATGIGDGQAIIRLYETANLSTFLHETGHFFLTVMQDLAANGEVSAATDLNVAKAWWRSNAADVAKDAMAVMPDVTVTADDVIAALDNGTTGDVLKDGAIDVGMQEQWARGFEAYLMDGKAPSVELRSAFEKFRAWLISVYKKLSGLNVQVSPELQSVFDRMLASDAEIAAAQQDVGAEAPVFATADEMGLSPDEYARFLTLRDQSEAEAKSKLLGEVMAPLKRERDKAYKAEKAIVRDEVEREINSLRFYRAFEWMANGKWVGGNQPDGLPDMRLSKAQLVERYGAGITSTLPRGKSSIYTIDGGMDVDEAAGWFGYESGDEMIRAIEKSPKRKEAIDAETEKVMRERHGDPLTDGSVEAAALDAVHGDKRGQWIAAELKAISEVAGSKVTLTAKEARASARQTLSRMKVRDAMNPSRFLAAERKAGNEAAKLGAMVAREKIWMDNARRRIANKSRAALREDGSPEAVAPQIETANKSTGNYNETVTKLIEAKRRQLVNHALYSEARKVADEVGKAENFIRKLNKPTSRERIGGAGRRDNAQIDYLGAIDDILIRYDFRKVSATAEDRRGSLNAFIAAMTEAGRENELAIPDNVLEDAGRKPYKTIPVEELRGVIDSLKNLEHVAKRWDELIDADQKRDRDAVVAGLLAGLDGNIGKRPPGRVGKEGIDWHKAKRKALDLILSPTTILREIDGFTDQGAAYQGIKAPIDTAMNRLTIRKEKAAIDFEGLYSVYSKTERRGMAVREHMPELGYALSKWERIALALNMGNEGNRQRLTDPRVRGAMTEPQIAAVLKTLDARDADFVQSVWDYIGSFRDDIDARERRTTGVEPGRVEAVAVTIGGKAVRGGYYPIKYDANLTALSRDDEANDIATSMQAGRFGKAQTRNGHLKARAKSSGRAIELDISVFHRHINSLLYDLELSEPVNNSWRVLQDARTKNAFIDAGRQPDFDTLETWLQDVAQGEVKQGDGFNRSARFIKTNFTAAKIGFNLSTVAMQVTGLAHSFVVVGKKDMARGIAKVASNPAEASRVAMEKSTFMKTRQDTFNKDVNDFYTDSKVGAAAGRWAEFRRTKWGPAAFFLMTKVQWHSTDVPTWHAGYIQGLRKFGNDEAKAVAHADDLVKRAQASGMFSDRSAIERGSVGRNARQQDIVRLFTTLGSYMFAKFNIAYERTQVAKGVISKEGLSARSAQEAFSYTIDMAFLFTLEAVLTAAVKGGLPGGEDDDDGWLLWLAKETGLSIMGTVPGVRDGASAMQGYSGGGAYGSAIEDASRGAVGVVNIVTSPFTDHEVSKSDIKAVINGAGLATGVPSTFVNRIIDAGSKQANGEEVSPLEYLLGRIKK